MSLDEAQQFLIDFTNKEYEAERAKLLEADHAKYIRLVWDLDEMYSGGITSGISRPQKDEGVYSSPENLEQAAELHPQSLFAVARYQQGEEELYRGWLGDFKVREHGEGMTTGFYVARVEGSLKIVTRLFICAGCMGSGEQPEGETCSYCAGDGWEFDGGQEIDDIGPMVELRKIKPPSDERYLRGYDKIQLP